MALHCKEAQREISVEICLGLFPVAWSNQRFISRHSVVAAEYRPGGGCVGHTQVVESSGSLVTCSAPWGWTVKLSPSLSRNSVVLWPHAHPLNHRKDFGIQNWLLTQGLDALVQLHPNRHIHTCPRGQHWASPDLSLQGTAFFPSVSFNLRTLTIFSPGGTGPCAFLSFLPSFLCPWTPHAPADCGLQTAAPEAPDPSCHHAALTR